MAADPRAAIELEGRVRDSSPNAALRCREPRYSSTKYSAFCRLQREMFCPPIPGDPGQSG